MNRKLAKLLRTILAGAKGDEAMALAIEAWKVSREAEARARLFDAIGHVMYSKTNGCPTHQGECRFHKNRFDKRPKNGWEKVLASEDRS